VISDIHANATALRAVLARVKALKIKSVLMLGDLLGYGPHVVETCALIEDCKSTFELRMIRGNHDQIYIELEQGPSPYLARLGDWLKESSQWTARQIKNPLSERYEWLWNTRYGRLHAHHANPFEDVVEGQKDWTYLNHDAQIIKAAEILKEEGAQAGVFGHNHRTLLAHVQGDTIERHDGVMNFERESEGAYVLNPGSVGQPRSLESRATFMTIDSHRAEIHRVEYDVDVHLKAIEKMNVSGATKSKLKGFFERAKAGAKA